MQKTEKDKSNRDIFTKNRDKFITELLNNLDGLEDNMLYEDMTKTDSPIVHELFEKLLEKQEIDSIDLVKAFEKFKVKSSKLPAHITLKAPFETEEPIEVLEEAIEKYIKDKKAIPYEIKGFEHFDN